MDYVNQLLNCVDRRLFAEGFLTKQDELRKARQENMKRCSAIADSIQRNETSSPDETRKRFSYSSANILLVTFVMVFSITLHKLNTW